MISIIIPCYNEGKKIKENIIRIESYLKENNYEYEIIIVNDGSNDDTLINLTKLKSDTVKFVTYENNMGKGYAIKQGVKKAIGRYIIFMDADLSTDLEAINSAIENLKYYDIVIGSRELTNSKVCNKSLSRKIVSKVCNLLIKTITGLNYKDTQCGFKAFRANIIKNIVDKQIINRFAFDVEYLYISSLKNYSVKEIPVIWNDDRDSRVNIIKSSIRFFKDILKIRNNKENYK